jgi:hypothetical protein
MEIVMKEIDAETAELEKYVAEIERLHSQKPDPTSLLLLKGHALIDDWLQRYVLFLNAIKPIDPDSPKLSPLSPEFKALYSSRRPPVQLNLNFIGKLREIERLRVLPKEIIDAIQRLNKIRNDYAHDFDTRITRNHIEFILKGLTQDQRTKELYEKKRKSLADDNALMGFVMAQIIVQLLGFHTLFVRLQKILR